MTSYESSSQGRCRDDVQWTATSLYEKLFSSPGRDRGFPRRAWTGIGPAPRRSSDGAAAPSGSWSGFVRDTSDQNTQTI